MDSSFFIRVFKIKRRTRSLSAPKSARRQVPTHPQCGRSLPYSVSPTNARLFLSQPVARTRVACEDGYCTPALGNYDSRSGMQSWLTSTAGYVDRCFSTDDLAVLEPAREGDRRYAW